MKKVRIIGAIMLVGYMGLSGASAQSVDMASKNTNASVEKTKNDPESSGGTYFVMAHHTPEQCMALGEEMKAKGDKYLSKFKFGCASGDHTSYSFINAASADEARSMLPMELQVNAKVVKVDAMTVKGMNAMHKEMK